MAASALALNIAAQYQTPHSYLSSHPLHRGYKFKSGGKKPAELKQQQHTSGKMTSARGGVKKEPQESQQKKKTKAITVKKEK